MKKIITFLTAVLLTANVIAQAPNKFSYQTVIRNTSGALVNGSVGIKISILQGSASGTVVFSETHAATTNTNGLASLAIGGGTIVSGSFAVIDWGTGPYFVKTETDPTGGTNYTITGTSELLSVPYALSSANGNWTQSGADIYSSNTGAVGVGTSAPADKLYVLDPGSLRVGVETQSNGYCGFRSKNSVAEYFQGINTATDRWVVYDNINFTERLSLLSTGEFGIGTDAPTANLSVNGTANNATGSWGVFSDARVKTVNHDFTDGLNVINKIRPVTFTYNADAPFKAYGEQIGVVAQDLEKIAPYMVKQNQFKDFNDLREVNNQAYPFLLINAIKEQQVQIEAQQKLIDALLKRLDVVEKRK